MRVDTLFGAWRNPVPPPDFIDVGEYHEDIAQCGVRGDREAALRIMKERGIPFLDMVRAYTTGARRSLASADRRGKRAAKKRRGQL